MATGDAIDQAGRLARKCLFDDKRALRATNVGVPGNLLGSVTVRVWAWRCTSVKTELAAVQSTHKDITEVAVVCLGVNCINKYITNGKLIITTWNIWKWNSNIVTFLPPRYLSQEYIYFVALKLIKLSYLWGFLLYQSKTKVWDPLEMKTLGFLSWAPQITYFITQR